MSMDQEFNGMPDNGQGSSFDGEISALNKPAKKKKQLIALIFAVVAVIVVICVFSPYIQRARISGTYYQYSNRFDGGIYYLGEVYCLELMSDGTCVFEGAEGGYTYKGGSISLTVVMLGIRVRMDGRVNGDVVELKQNAMFGSSGTMYYKKADSYPG